MTDKFVLDADALVDPIFARAQDWPQKRKDRFVAEWEALLAAGAEWVEFVTDKGTIGVRLSDDLMAHCRAYGLVD